MGNKHCCNNCTHSCLRSCVHSCDSSIQGCCECCLGVFVWTRNESKNACVPKPRSRGEMLLLSDVAENGSVELLDVEEYGNFPEVAQKLQDELNERDKLIPTPSAYDLDRNYFLEREELGVEDEGESKKEGEEEEGEEEGEEEEEVEKKVTLRDLPIRPFGLKNIGMYTCFLNASMQLLSSIPELIQHSRARSKLEEIYRHFSQITQEQLEEWKRQEYLEEFVDWSIQNDIITDNDQNDPLVFFYGLMSNMKVYPKCLTWKIDTISECHECHQIFPGFEESSIVHVVSASMFNSFQEYCDSYSRNTKISKTHPFTRDSDLEDFCEKCDKETQNTSFKVLSHLPQYLLFRIDRGEELEIPIQTNEMIKFDDKEYEIIGCVVNLASSVTFGHDISIVKRYNKWYECNDSVITEMENSEVKDILDAKNNSTEFKRCLVTLYKCKV